MGAACLLYADFVDKFMLMCKMTDMDRQEATGVRTLATKKECIHDVVALFCLWLPTTTIITKYLRRCNRNNHGGGWHVL